MDLLTEPPIENLPPDVAIDKPTYQRFWLLPKVFEKS